MPITPFHLGPGAALKAVAPRHFSFTVFCFAQCATDAEVLFYMVQGESPVHRHLHSYVGAVGVGIFSVAVGWPICSKILALWRANSEVALKRLFNPSGRIRPVAAFTGAFLGSFSHVFLDSLMHADMRPWMPWNQANNLLNSVGPGALHALCFVLGVLGLWVHAQRQPTRSP